LQGAQEEMRMHWGWVPHTCHPNTAGCLDANTYPLKLFNFREESWLTAREMSTCMEPDRGSGGSSKQS